MKGAGLLFLLAAPLMQFHVTDGRGKETGAVTIEFGAADADGWRPLKIAKAKGDAVLVWPFDAMAKPPDGPEPVPAIVIQRGAEKALANKAAMASIATPVVLGWSSIDEAASKTGFTSAALMKAFGELAGADDAFQKGVGLLYAAKYEAAAAALPTALRERQRQLTRVPSEIYAAAMLAGAALAKANKFDEAAVAYLAAMKQRPSDQRAAKLRGEALVKAGKPEAAGR